MKKKNFRGLNVCTPRKFYVEILIPKVIELGGGIFEGCSDQEGGALMSGTKGTDGFVQETPERALTIPYVRLQSHFLLFFLIGRKLLSNAILVSGERLMYDSGSPAWHSVMTHKESHFEEAGPR